MIVGVIISLILAIIDATKSILLSTDKIREFSHTTKTLFLFGCDVLVYSLYVAFEPSIITGTIKPMFWYYSLTQTIVIIVALRLYLHALSCGSIARTHPILGLTPALLLITNPIMTNDVITTAGWFGVILIVIGIYASQLPEQTSIHSIRHKPLAPIAEIFKHNGVRSMLGTAILFSISANLDKLCIQTAPTMAYLFINSLMSFIVLLIIVWINNSFLNSNKCKIQPITQSLNSKALFYLTIAAVIGTISSILHMQAISLIAIPYVVAIKRLSIILASYWAFFVRKDHQSNWARLLGTIIVCIGVALVSIAG